MSQNKPGFFRDPIWTFVGVLIACAALLFGVFTWIVPNINHSDNGTSTPTPIIVTSRTPTANNTSSPTNAPSSSSENKPFTCTSGTLCNTYSMSISVFDVVTGTGTSTWTFQIKNIGIQEIDAYLQIVSVGELKVFGGDVHLKPDAMQLIPVKFSFAPNNGDSVDITLEFLIMSSLSRVDYSQTCTYSGSSCQ